MIMDLRKELENYSIEIDENKLNLLKKFYLFLEESNKKVNLISRRNFNKTFYTLTFQSIWVGNKISSISSLIDVGSGAGFPGIPIKIYLPSIKIYLVEPNKKKVNF
ncbi:class I SAM-dependent methyltransferase [SCandidatus Aminicenantes bacterium Aminicenantia_JdfR_composite]|jgi:16S rRNA (guanine527-N7)-methyltransferase|nr:class I SAM-dependent methyltransferase [SCandidatus Aminicenantes bacterium Aminicenantia_JdfR_composite]MCP2597805.1 class I SAM-dependent methyltransferase [Candidatus Aminicenantes bacterium AC-335-L06]MCP2620530.1 class I SAM-dependent methyltransferase [Candidatus Aminicenantes bacterium AC-334-E05]